MSTRRRIALVGCGAAGQQHADALGRAGWDPVALIDPDVRRAELVAAPWPDALVAPAPGPIADAFDVAIVTAPDQLHAPITIELLEAGKDVLVEKPMACTRADAAAMVDAAAASGRVLAVAQARRHLAVEGWVHTVIRSGALGAVLRVDASQGGRDDWVATSRGYVGQAAGGVIASAGVYTIDLLGWWLGALDVVACTHDSRGWQEAEATIELRAGTIPVTFSLSRMRPLRNTVRLHTERGLLEVALDHFQPRQLVAAPPGLGIEPFVEVVDDLPVQFDRQLVAFADALDGRWPATLATAADGSAIAAVIEDCYACRTFDEPWWMASAVPR